jgi:hypothetical protein
MDENNIFLIVTHPPLRSCLERSALSLSKGAQSKDPWVDSTILSLVVIPVLAKAGNTGTQEKKCITVKFFLNEVAMFFVLLPFTFTFNRACYVYAFFFVLKLSFYIKQFLGSRLRGNNEKMVNCKGFQGKNLEIPYDFLCLLRHIL